MNNTQFFQKQEFLSPIFQKTIFTIIFGDNIKKEKIKYLGKKRYKFYINEINMLTLFNYFKR